MEGELLHSFKKRKELKMIKNLNSNYIICGYSGVAVQIAEELKVTNRLFVIVEKDPAHCKLLEEKTF